MFEEVIKSDVVGSDEVRVQSYILPGPAVLSAGPLACQQASWPISRPSVYHPGWGTSSQPPRLLQIVFLHNENCQLISYFNPGD